MVQKALGQNYSSSILDDCLALSFISFPFFARDWSLQYYST